MNYFLWPSQSPGLETIVFIPTEDFRDSENLWQLVSSWSNITKSLNSMISTYKNPLYGTLGTFQKRDFKSQYLFVWKRLDPCHIFGWVVFFRYPKYFQRCPNRDKSTSTTRRKIRKNSTEWVKSLILATLKGLSLFFFRFSVCALTLPGPVKGHK